MLEEIPFVRAMLQGRITLADHIEFLCHLYQIHTVLEAEIERQLSQFERFQPLGFRRGVLRRDLINLGVADPGEPHPLVGELQQKIQKWAAESPWCLLGCLHALDAMRTGSTDLVEGVAKAIRRRPLPGNGLDFYLEATAQPPTKGRVFRAVLERAELCPEARAEVIQAVLDTTDVLFDLYATLDVAPPEEPVRFEPDEPRMSHAIPTQYALESVEDRAIRAAD